uniref:Chloride channel protein CLC-d n=1 Tax=Ananas comosus var. bracteatus TaxID=296719 RepID=A0A6V7Q440_ANACO|nr:unnamed protein product [Ananas comosus var. bracteatus]
MTSFQRKVIPIDFSILPLPPLPLFLLLPHALDHLQNGIETAKLVWSRLPTAEDDAGPAAAAEEEDVFARRSNGGSGMESLDYEIIENYAYREHQAQRGKLWVSYYVVVKWLFALLIGIGTGYAAVFINLAVENFSGWKYAATFSIIQHSYFAGFLVYILINLGLVFSSVFIITHFAPAAAGSGIPEIKGYLNGVDTHGILLFRTLVGKIFGSIGSVGGGLALGKEGPLVHTGACIASLLGQIFDELGKKGFTSTELRQQGELTAEGGLCKDEEMSRKKKKGGRTEKVEEATREFEGT